MKHKNLFLKIYIPFVIITIIALIVLQILGSKVRVGYFTDFNLNIERTLSLNDLTNINESFTVDGKLDEESIKNYLLTNENITNYVHHFRIRYYDKTFRNSDIYGVYPDLSGLPDYMENAEMEYNGSPFGNFIYDKKFVEIEKIDNINYTLKVKYNLVFIVIMLYVFFILYYLYKTNNKFKQLLTCNYITRLDWIIFIIISIILFLSFNQFGDMKHTISSSFAYLNGHIFDFYKYNATLEYIVGNNYMPSTYILFAIWNIPLKLLFSIDGSNIGLLTIYYNKIFTTLFYIASAILVYKISKTIGFDDKKSKITSFLWLTTPIAIYSQFIFGQYDIFTVFFTLLGVYFYFKNDNFKFALFFGISLTFKYFPAFIFITLLIYREKNILRIIKQCVIFIIPFAIELLIYRADSAFRYGVLGFGAISYIFGLMIQYEYYTAKISIKIFLILWIFICGYVYFNNEIKNKTENEKWIFYYLSLVSFMLFGLSLWHPQWVIFITPFLVFGTVINKKYNIFMLLDIFLMLFFTCFVVNVWQALNSHTLANGIFSNMFDIDNTSLLMKSILEDKYSLSYTLFSGLLLLNALFKHPKYDFDNIKEDISDAMPFIRLRLVIGMMIFIITFLYSSFKLIY